MNYIGYTLVSVLLWSSFAALGKSLAHIPALQLVGISLGIGSIYGWGGMRDWFRYKKTLAFGTLSFFCYHYLLLTAIRHAPALQANLLNYLWPIFTVLFAALFLKGYRLTAKHIAGSLLALAGAVLVIAGRGLSGFQAEHLQGYAMALGAAVVWALYSVFTKKLSPFPTHLVGGFCLLSSLLALAVHALTAPFSLSPQDLPLLVLLGLGPMGIAFYTWDLALKRGDPRIVGILSYLTPPLSTAALALTSGQNLLAPSLLLALALILGGAYLSSLK